MTSPFHRPPGVPFELGRTRRVTWRLHPALSDVLTTLDGTSFGKACTDRAAEISMAGVFADPVDQSGALTAHRWVLERADGEGLPLTAAGYLKPADVKALAALMPVMSDWIFPVSREVDAHPVLDFREHLKLVGLLRKYKGTLRLTKAGRAVLVDTPELWRYLANALIPPEHGFAADASVVILLDAATAEGEIDIDAIARTVTALGWSHRDGSPVSRSEIHGVWNGLWNVIGNIGERADGHRSERKVSAAARMLIHNALFEEVGATGQARAPR